MSFSCKHAFLCRLHAVLHWQIRNHTQQGWDRGISWSDLGHCQLVGPGVPQQAGVQAVHTWQQCPLSKALQSAYSLKLLQLHLAWAQCTGLVTQSHRQERFRPVESTHLKCFDLLHAQVHRLLLESFAKQELHMFLQPTTVPGGPSPQPILLSSSCGMEILITQ